MCRHGAAVAIFPPSRTRTRIRGDSISRLKTTCVTLIIAAALGTAGCKSSSGDATATAVPKQKVTVTKKRGPGTGPFTAVTIGDSMDKVKTALGDATTSRGHFMGKNFNPFYFGTDRYHTIWYYAGKGRVTFNIKARVMLIENDRGRRA